MTPREVHLELLLGRRVRDSRGRAAGRIEEVVADREDLDCVVREFHLGPHALVERLSLPLVRILRGRSHGLRRVPWDRLDLTDPVRPRLTCTLEELA
jgi:sporulation protein YlmC with PRC-barrel domain